MSDKHTLTYEHLTTQVPKLQALVTHERFKDVVRDNVQFEMLTELVKLLDAFLGHAEVRSFDSALVHSGPPSDLGLRTPEADWLAPGRPEGALDRVIEEAHAMAYGSLEDPRNLAERFREALAALFDVSAAYVEQSTHVDHPVTNACRFFRSRLRSLEVQEMRLYIEKSAEALNDIRGLREDAQGAAKDIKEAAGISSDAALSTYYGLLADDEQKAANVYRGWTIFLAIVGVGTAALFVAGHNLGLPLLDVAAGDYVHLIQRAVFIAGVFGIAGYFARQAHQHRSMANWARALSVQLQTFDGYLRDIDNADVKDELRKAFAARVFGDHPAMKGEPTVTPSAAAMDTAVGWAAKLTGGGK